ncbi:hypothetical protein ENBRE01_0735 [Enteropsectra breve]|nr:hypothetical protein ENBRE01_0735 [Enteropsectra breve]
MIDVCYGREVSPRNIEQREHKAIITGIKSDKFVVIKKQDKTFELIRLEDVILNDKVYTEEEINNENSEFYSAKNDKKAASDFEKFKADLEKQVIQDMLKEKGMN